MGKKRIRRGLVAGAAVALLVAPAAPAPASTPVTTDACRIMGPHYVEDAYNCVCGTVARVLTAATGESWYCAAW
jgi:hypothetical protein